MSTDRIVERARYHAPRSRVWRALVDPQEFGAWFGVAFAPETRFVAGESVSGRITHPGYEHVTWEVLIDEIVPESRFAWRWHPFAVDANVDYANEPRTLCTFTLEDTPDGGTLVTLVESGFDALPSHRQGEARQRNGEGWTEQIQRRLPQHLGA